ncbi:MAG: hypothetical protein ACSHWW_02975 [Nonlabens sp.]|uniref:hypothetical protein n=1 Tax=Nonlabens sp. TaxID=1888209 RepID=UPI003EF32CE7
MMRFTILLVIMMCAMASSCRTQEQNETEANQIAQQRLQEIDLSQPDTYPLFEGCGELENATTCFYEKLQEQVALKLKDHQLQFEITQRDSVMAVLLVNKKGTISYQGLQVPPVNSREKMVDSLLQSRLHDICKIDPATKNGIPVSASFLLPVVIKPAIH